MACPGQPTLHIPNKPGTNPGVGILPLVPVHKALPPRNARVRRPRATQNNIVLAVEEVGRVRGVQGHGLEALVGEQGRAGPLPRAAHLTLAGEAATTVGDGDGVPVTEADVGFAEVDVQAVVVSGVAIGTPGRGLGRRCLLDAVVDEMSGTKESVSLPI